MPTEGERLATLEQIARDTRDDIHAWTAEQERSRKRLHELETTVRGLVLANQITAKAVSDRQRRVEINVQILMLVVVIGATISPLIVYLMSR